ncbi:unnamed protein product [Nyctereutes procyonoides]|uniref:(raccoon dog) hypothetical protein n=1 Tax=Nyctereutes procyonoides TaxID=34880 RepID=A0A811Z367_NYCPR|nr:unnamed protein product [Nyctereutes procyonoides]
MNHLWSICGKILTEVVIISPPCAAPKKQLPSVPQNALLITRPTSPVPATPSMNGTHASYEPSTWNTLFLQNLPWLGSRSYQVSMQNGECPRLVLDIPIFHLLVDPTSDELWNHNHIWQVFMYVRKIFYKIDTPLLQSKVVDSVEVRSACVFPPGKPSVHDEARGEVTIKVHVAGLLWVKPGSV